MYDPVIGRVLSPDNGACPDNGGVQDPTNTQSYNRYSYCLNNPLRYTDPSGWLSSADWANYYENKANSEFAFLEGVGFRSNPSYSDNGGGGGSSGISWTDYLHDPRENFVMMSSKAYNQMYGPGKYVKMQAARRNPDFCGPDKYGVYSKGSTVTNRFGKWFFISEHVSLQIADYTIIQNVPTVKVDGGSGKTVQTIVKASNVVDIALSTTEQTIQTTRAGSNFVYAISGSSKAVSIVSNTIKYAPYAGLLVTVGTGSYLSVQKDPATGRPYQSWSETGTDIGANIATIFIGAKYGGWYGAGAAVLYLGVKYSADIPYDYYLPNGEINPGMQFIFNKE